MSIPSRALWLLAVAVLLGAGCGDDSGASGVGDDRPTVVATTSILGDVLQNLVGDQAEIVTIMPLGADPHDFQASAQQANQIRQADVLIANGAGFEEGLLDVIEAAENDGVATFEAISAVETLDLGESDPAEDVRDDDHDDSGVDPHFFTDPDRMADAVDGISDFLAENVEGLDTDLLDQATAAYIEELETLDDEVSGILDDLDVDARVLVTNHTVFGYFADRYDFEIVGAVVPSGTTASASSAGDLAALADAIEEHDVRAIFADTSSASDLAETLAEEVGDIEVIDLFSESLGEDGSDGATYLDMVRTNAERIARALG